MQFKLIIYWKLEQINDEYTPFQVQQIIMCSWIDKSKVGFLNPLDTGMEAPFVWKIMLISVMIKVTSILLFIIFNKIYYKCLILYWNEISLKAEWNFNCIK